MQKKSSKPPIQLDAHPLAGRTIRPLKEDVFSDRILPSENEGAFSKYAILKPAGNNRYKQTGGDLKEKK